MYLPTPVSLPEQEAAKLAKFFGSEERKLLERLIRTKAADELVKSGNLLNESAEVYLAEGKIDKLDSYQRKQARFAIALKVIAEMQELITVKENMSQAVVTDNILILP